MRGRMRLSEDLQTMWLHMGCIGKGPLGMLFKLCHLFLLILTLHACKLCYLTILFCIYSLTYIYIYSKGILYVFFYIKLY